MNRQSLIISALAVCFLVIAIQWATAPEGVAQIGGKSQSTFDTIEASAFLLKDESGEVVGGLTTGPGWLAKQPTLFLQQDSVRVHLTLGSSSVGLAFTHKAGPAFTILVENWQTVVDVKSGRKTPSLRLVADSSNAEILTYK